MKLLTLLVKPIIKYNVYFIFFLILIGIPEILSGIHIHYIETKTFNWGIINLAATIFIESYISTLILFLLPFRIKTLYIYITFILTTLHFMGSIFLMQMYGCVLNDHIMSVILNSNREEIIEYLSMYLPDKYFPIIIMFFIAIFASYYLIKNTLKFSKCNSLLIGIFLVISALLTIRRPIYFEKIFPYKYVKGFNPQNKVPDLSEFVEEIHLTYLKKERPLNVVLIIGESFNKFHSSLYGYNKNTNPLLSKLKEDSLLYLYTNVTSPATNTVQCFKNIMSTYKSEYGDSIAWYRCTTLINILKEVDYNTFWISNQSKRGIYDNIPSRYAELCDTAFFVGDKYAGLARKTFDEDIIPLLKPLLVEDKHSFYVCHLMGSHSQFNMRYPQEFERFTISDYENYPEVQRSQRATYDNSILYNDSVVYELMNLFMNKEAIVFYFSDHAIDVYQSSEEYIGHALLTNTKSIEVGTSIPFMIFTSPLFKKKFSAEMELIKEYTQQPFRTDDMIPTIMDLIGISFVEESLDGKSLFRNK